MKRALITFVIGLFTALVVAQSHDAFKYQAAVRNAEGEIIVEQTVSFRISILQGAINGT